MSMLSLFDQTTIPALDQTLQFAQARHGILAGNIANMDTPGYQVRDLSLDNFQAKLKEALAARHTAALSDSENAIPRNPAEAMRQVDEATRDILYHDGSDLSLEKQILEISKNQAMHNMAIAIMSNQFRMLNVAISERI